MTMNAIQILKLFKQYQLLNVYLNVYNKIRVFTGPIMILVFYFIFIIVFRFSLTLFTGIPFGLLRFILWTPRLCFVDLHLENLGSEQYTSEVLLLIIDRFISFFIHSSRIPIHIHKLTTSLTSQIPEIAFDTMCKSKQLSQDCKKLWSPTSHCLQVLIRSNF